MKPQLDRPDLAALKMDYATKRQLFDDNEYILQLSDAQVGALYKELKRLQYEISMLEAVGTLSPTQLAEG